MSLLQCSAFLQKEATSAFRYSAPSKASSSATGDNDNSVKVSTKIFRTVASNCSAISSNTRRQAFFDATATRSPNCVVVASPSVLVQLGVFDGAFVLIQTAPAVPPPHSHQNISTTPSKEAELPSHRIISRLVCLRSNREPSVGSELQTTSTAGNAQMSQSASSTPMKVCLPPLLAYNLRLHYEGFEARHVRVKKSPRYSVAPIPTPVVMSDDVDTDETDGGGRKHQGEEKGDQSLDIAQRRQIVRGEENLTEETPLYPRCAEIAIKRILSHGSVTQSKYCVQALRRFFNTPRLLHVGDLFAVEVKTPAGRGDHDRHGNWSHQLHRMAGMSSQADDSSSDGSGSESDDSSVDSESSSDSDDVIETESPQATRNNGAESGIAAHQRRQMDGRRLARILRRVHTNTSIAYFQVARLVRHEDEGQENQMPPDFASADADDDGKFGWGSTEWSRLIQDGVANIRLPPARCERDLKSYNQQIHQIRERPSQRQIASQTSTTRPSSGVLPSRKVFAGMISKLRRLLRPSFDPAFPKLHRVSPVLLYGVSAKLLNVVAQSCIGVRVSSLIFVFCACIAVDFWCFFVCSTSHEAVASGRLYDVSPRSWVSIL